MRNILIILMIVIAIFTLGYVAWNRGQESGTSSPNSEQLSSASASSTSASSAGISVSSKDPSSSQNPISGSGYTIKQVPIKNLPPAPSYTAPLTFDSSLSADEEAQFQKQFQDVEATLKAKPTDFNGWIMLGILRKEAGDYAAAATDWNYVSALYPDNVVSYANLGDLYTNFLHDYPKAAAAYQKEIQVNPTDIYIYQDLYSLYTNQYRQSSSVVEAMLRQGVAANPNSTDLQTLLSTYEAAHK